MNFTFQGIVGPGAMVLQTSLNSGAPATVAFADELTGNGRVGGAILGVQTSLATLADRLAKGASRYSDEGFADEARRAVDGGLAPAYRLAIESTYKARGEVEAEHIALHTPKFPESSTPDLRAELRQYADRLSLPARLEAANADPALAAAIVEAGPARSALPADSFDRLRRTMAAGQLADAIQRDLEFRTRQTPDDPVAGLPDRAAALAAAGARLDALDAERDLIATVPRLLSDVISVVASMTGESRQAAFERLNG